MGTSFQEIYESFLSRVSTYELAMLEETKLESNLQEWLINALPYFTNCKKDLDNYDKEFAHFNEKLSNSEITILAVYMVYLYASTFLMREENLAQALNSKDYRMYSPQGQLKALTSLQEHLAQEANTLKSQYSWNVKSIREMFKRDN